MTGTHGGTRTVFVTGASRGIGLCLAGSLASAGYHVVGVARGPSAEWKEMAAGTPGATEFLAADLSGGRGLVAAAAELRACRTLYGLVNNAATAPSGLHASLDPRLIRGTLDLNVGAPMVLSQAAAKAMRRHRDGRIVNVSSICAHRTYRGLGLYTASKAALEGFSRVLATEVGAWGVTVNCVAPGYIETAMNAHLPAKVRERIVRRTALDRPPEGSDVARVVEFLLSPAARSVTGEVVRVDAGAAA